MNLPLKLAIVSTQRTQRAIARSSGIPEVRLSKIVNGVPPGPTPKEQRDLARVLGAPAAALFAELDAATA